MGHDDLLGEDLFTSELDDDSLMDPVEEEDLDDMDLDGGLDLEDEDLLDEDDDDYSGGYNPDEWN